MIFFGQNRLLKAPEKINSKLIKNQPSQAHVLFRKGIISFFFIKLVQCLSLFKIKVKIELKSPKIILQRLFHKI